jgi:hypothetical protein
MLKNVFGPGGMGRRERVPAPFASVATLPALSAPGHAASNVVHNTEGQGQCGPDNSNDSPDD